MKSQSLLDIVIALVLIAYWGICARRVKKDRVRRTIPWDWLLLALMAALVLLADRLPFAQTRLIPPSPAITLIGTGLQIAGLALAVWGRRQLGANWSSAASVKEGHELVISGPYRLVRHPIYAGFLWAMLGAALTGNGLLWFAGLAILLPVFLYRMHVEESLMSAEFPDQYPEFQRRTKRVIPFVW
jgi:protein-S-isoprenylcysteine O-methyltransferase Ste14